MEHLEWHNHAYIDENNTVIGVAVFQESAHDTQLLESVKEMYGAKQTVCCCTFGLANVGDIWTGTEFRPSSPYPSWVWNFTTKSWNAPVPMPVDYTDDGRYFEWDEPTVSWVLMLWNDTDKKYEPANN